MNTIVSELAVDLGNF